MNTEYYLVKVREKGREVQGLLDVASVGKNFYTSPSVERSLVKIEEHLEKAGEEAKRIHKHSF